jgi:hypothetical protein
MLFLSTLRMWRYESAARRTRHASEGKRKPAVRKRKPGVELLEDRVPMGTFFNGFGLGSSNILPLGLTLPESTSGSALRSAATTQQREAIQGLDDNAAALTVAMLSRATGTDSGGAAAPVSEGVDSLVTNTDTGWGLSSWQTSTGSGGEVVPPNMSLHPATFAGFAPPPVQTTHGPSSGPVQPPAPAPNNSANNAQLFQAVSAVGAGAGQSSPGGATSSASPSPRAGSGGSIAKLRWYPSVGNSGGSTTTTGLKTAQSTVVNQSQYMKQFGAILPAASTRVGTAVSTKSPLVGTIQDASQFIGGFGNDQIEESIAINPTNTNNIVVEANAIVGGGLIGSMLSYTFDNGNTWHPSFLGTGNSSLNDQSNGDPWVLFDRFGNLWISYLDAGSISTPEAIPDGPVVLLSTNGGIGYHIVEDFEDPTNPSVGIDQPKMAVGDNSIWLIWQDAPSLAEPDGRIQSASAYIGGLGQWQGFFAFNDGPTTPTSTFQNFGTIAVGPRGQVVYTFQDPNSAAGPDSIWMSLNPLGTRGFFATPTLVTTVNVGGFAPVTLQPLRTISSFPGVAYDRSNGPHRGRLYMVYTDRTTVSSNSTDIFEIFSDNDGATWSPPVRVTDDHTGLPKIWPRIAVDQTTGHVAISWIDSRNDPGFGPGDTDGFPGTDGEEFMAFSADGGKTFSQNIQVSQHPSNAQTIFFYSGFDWGDYSALDFYGGVARPAWPDNSLDTASVDTAVPLDMNIATAAVKDPFTGVGGGGGGFTDTLINGLDNDTSDVAVNEGVLFSTSSVSNVQIGPNGTDTFPDADWFKWTMAHSGTFSAKETTDAGGPLELHVFKLSGGSLVSIGNAVGNSVNSVSASVSANDIIFVEVKGTTSGSTSSTGQYHLNVSLA